LARVDAALVQLGRSLRARPEISAVDLNPVIVAPECVMAVDALVETESEADPPS
jgi:hypothetical protein